MCGSGCSSSREPTIDSGALLAIIHPSFPSPLHSPSPPPFPGATLHLTNSHAGPTQSILSLNTPPYPSPSPSEDSRSRSPSPALSTTSTMSTMSTMSSASPYTPSQFLIQIHEFSTSSRIMHCLPHEGASGGGSARLDLSVGGTGIVGRAVSVVDARTGTVVGEGVVGWGR